MNLEFPDPLSFNPKHPSSVRRGISEALYGVPGGSGPIQPRVAQEGRISMFEYLNLLDDKQKKILGFYSELIY